MVFALEPDHLKDLFEMDRLNAAVRFREHAEDVLDVRLSLLDELRNLDQDGLKIGHPAVLLLHSLQLLLFFVVQFVKECSIVDGLVLSLALELEPEPDQLVLSDEATAVVTDDID